MIDYHTIRKLMMFNICIKTDSNDRTSCNAYYIECKKQHPYGASEMVLIGYGVCDIGLWDDEKYIYRILDENRREYEALIKDGVMASGENAAGPSWTENMAHEMHAITHDESLAMRNGKANAYFVFDDSSGIGFELLCDSILTRPYLGINRDRYASFIADYPRGYLPVSA